MVKAFAGADAALDAARSWQPDLLLAEIGLSTRDGSSLLKTFRADAELRDAPVILLSARAKKDAEAEGPEAGAGARSADRGAREGA